MRTCSGDIAPVTRQHEDGFTLIEVLVAMSIFLVVLGVTLGLLTSVSRAVRKDEARTGAVADARVGIGRMVRELRQATEVIDMSGSMIDVYARIGGANVRLRYDCDAASPDDPANPYDQFYRRCVRRTAPVVDPTSTTPPTLPDITAADVIVDRICPGASTVSCDSAASAPVFTCRTGISAPATPCAQLPPPPPDPDDPVDPLDPPPDPVFPTMIEVNVQVPARGSSDEAIYSHRLVLNDGVQLRNVAIGYELNS
jgi:prepilin-type N-terminal cleavage/methylation domain-containing protein